MTTIRTFIAIELDDGLKATLARLQSLLRDRVPPRAVRWVQPEGIHLTLKFLGDTPVDKLEAIEAALAKAAVQVEPFGFNAGGVGCFPDLRRPRVVWVGLHEPTGALTRLWKAVESHVSPLGFPTESRPFSPHLTLGRVQREVSGTEVRELGQAIGALAPDLADIKGKMAVGSVGYIRSDLRPGGAVYTRLFEAPLKS